MDRALIRKRCGFVQLSMDGQAPLPTKLIRELEQELTYTFLEFSFGGRNYNPVNGQRHAAMPEPRRLFVYDNSGLFCCQKGYLPRIREKLQQFGIEYRLDDLDEAKPAHVYEENWDRLVSSFQFRPEQDTCVAQIAAHDGGIIDAITAFGKMYVMAMVCVLYPRAKIHIVTKSKSVARSIHTLLTRWVPNMGFVGDNKRKISRVTVYMADSLQHSDYDADIVLADECHELCTENYASKLARYHHARMFGFTASKETRADNTHARLEGLFGPTIFHIDYPTGAALGLVAPITVQWNDVNMQQNPVSGMRDLVRRKQYGIWRNDYRNQVIANSVMPFVNDGKQVLIAVETIEHAVNLKRMLPFFQLCYAAGGLKQADRLRYISDGYLTEQEPEMTPMRVEWLRRAFERREVMYAIANSIWSTGVSFDSLEVQVRAEGTSSETKSVQVPGRVCRISPATNKAEGIVLDFMDNFDEKFRGASLARRRSYSSRGWTQILPNGRLFVAERRQGAQNG